MRANSIDTKQGRRSKGDIQRQYLLRGSLQVSGLVSIAAGIVAWELAGNYLGFRFLPPFSDVIVASADTIMDRQFWEELLISMRSLALGYGLAVSLGMLLGTMIGVSRTVEIMFDFYLEVLLSTPKLIFAPIMLSIFGTGRESHVALIVLFAMPVIIVNTSTGIRTVKQSWLEMARSFGASRRQLFQRVMLPGAAPLLMTGLSLGLTRGVRGMIAGEMFIAVVGIGAQLRRAGNRFDVVGVWGILVVIVLFSLVTLLIFNRISRIIAGSMTQH